jgi:hypothetical protein
MSRRRSSQRSPNHETPPPPPAAAREYGIPEHRQTAGALAAEGEAKMSELCSVPHCSRWAYVRGLCHYHYEKARLDALSPCSAPGCEKRTFHLGLCMMHYSRDLRRRRKEKAQAEK